MANYQQLKAPNLSVSAPVGMCLNYARTAFGAPGGITYAWQAWQKTAYKHADQNFPGYPVPIWFSWVVNGQEEGHVAIQMPNGQIYSSPWKTGTGHAVLPSIAELIRIYGDNGKHQMTYQGWSEDINGVRVVVPVADPTPAPSGSPLATYVGHTVHLAPSAGTWKVYKVGSVAPRTAVATLNPGKYGGLSYVIKSTDTSPNSVVITTQQFGNVSIPIAQDNKGTLYPTATIS